MAKRSRRSSLSSSEQASYPRHQQRQQSFVFRGPTRRPIIIVLFLMGSAKDYA